MISRIKIGLGNLMNEAPKPGDFPVGSVESRAAVRAMIEREKETGLRWRIIMTGHRPEDCQGRWCSGECGLVTGRFFVNGDGEVEQLLVNHGRV